MELTEIPGIGPAYKERLQSAGVPDVAALAREQDLDALAGRASIPAPRLQEFAGVARRLSGEGAADARTGTPEAPPADAAPPESHEPAQAPEAAAAAAAAPVAASAAGSTETEGASEATEGQPRLKPREAAEEVVMAVRQAAEEMRVVLRERASTARVRLQGMWHEDVPIVPAKEEENEQSVAQTLKRNGVILKEKAETAIAVINDEVVENLPIFQERVKRGAQDVQEEIRVRVAEVRQRTATGSSPLSRFFRRGGGSGDKPQEPERP